MSGSYGRRTDWLSIVVLLATFVVVAGAVTLGAAVLAEAESPTPQPSARPGLVFKVPTRAPTPTRFASPTPAPTPTRAPTPTSLATAVPTAVPTQTEVVEASDDLIKATARSVVRVTYSGGSGTAFRVEGSGTPQFVTSFHVVEKVSSVTLVAPDGSKHAGTVARREPAADLAVITAADLGSIPALGLATDPPAAGDKLFFLGYGTSGPSATTPAATRGAVSGRRVVGSLEYLQTSAAMGPGSAGGPVVSPAGKVLGVGVDGLRDEKGAVIQGASFAVPAAIVRAFLKSPA